MESERDTIGSLKERVSRLLRMLEDCRKEKEKILEELEGLKRKHLETLRELEEMKALIDSVLGDEG
jgi:predicted  nucleic acid-binding Zn-ribbon protein